MNYRLLLVLLLISSCDGMEGELPLDDVNSDSGNDSGDESENGRGSRNSSEQEFLLRKKHADLLKNPEILRTITKRVPIVTKPSASTFRIVDSPNDENLSKDQENALAKIEQQHRDAIKAEMSEQSSKNNLQLEVQRAEDALVEQVKNIPKMYGAPNGPDLGQAENLLKKITAYQEVVTLLEKSSDSATVGSLEQSALAEKVEAVKALLEDTVKDLKDRTREKEEKVTQETQAKKEADARAAAEKQSAQAALEAAEKLLQPEEKAELEVFKKRVSTYLQDPLISSIASGKLFAIGSSSADLVVNLEAIALREFSLDDALNRLSDNKVLIDQLQKVKDFEAQAFAILKSNALDFDAVSGKIERLLGWKGMIDQASEDPFKNVGPFRMQAERRIQFLKTVMDSLDETTRQYVIKNTAPFGQGALTSIEPLLYPEQTLAEGLEQSLGTFESPLSPPNKTYQDQNQLYALVRQLDLCSNNLHNVVTSIALVPEIDSEKYANDLREQGVDLPGNPTPQEIAQALRRVLSPEYAREFAQAEKDSENYSVGQKLVHQIGKNFFFGAKNEKVSAAAESGDGYCFSEIDGNMMHKAFEALVKGDDATFVHRPVGDWRYVSADFVKEVGVYWLNHYEENFDFTQTGVTAFEKEQLLCNAWQFAKGESISLFRDLGAEFLSSPLARTMAFNSLEGKPSSSFTEKQTAAAIEVSKDGDDLVESGNLAESRGTLRKVIADLSTSLAVTQGPARAGVSFLDEMQQMLSDKVRIEQLIANKQLSFVEEELTAFQQAVLQGRDLDDFSNEWWQLELYERASLFKLAVHNLDLVTSNPTPEFLDAQRMELLAKIESFPTLTESLIAHPDFADLNNALRYQSLSALEGVLLEKLGLEKQLTPAQKQMFEGFFAQKPLFVKLLGLDNYAAESKELLWKQRSRMASEEMKAFDDDNHDVDQLIVHPHLLANVEKLVAYYEVENPNTSELTLWQRAQDRLNAYAAIHEQSTTIAGLRFAVDKIFKDIDALNAEDTETTIADAKSELTLWKKKKVEAFSDQINKEINLFQKLLQKILALLARIKLAKQLLGKSLEARELAVREKVLKKQEKELQSIINEYKKISAKHKKNDEVQ